LQIDKGLTKISVSSCSVILYYLEIFILKIITKNNRNVLLALTILISKYKNQTVMDLKLNHCGLKINPYWIQNLSILALKSIHCGLKTNPKWIDFQYKMDWFSSHNGLILNPLRIVENAKFGFNLNPFSGWIAEPPFLVE